MAQTVHIQCSVTHYSNNNKNNKKATEISENMCKLQMHSLDGSSRTGIVLTVRAFARRPVTL